MPRAPARIAAAQPHASISLAVMAHAEDDDSDNEELVFIPRDALEQWIELDAAIHHDEHAEPARAEASCSGWIGPALEAARAGSSASHSGRLLCRTEHDPSLLSTLVADGASSARSSESGSLAGSLPDMPDFGNVLSLRGSDAASSGRLDSLTAPAARAAGGVLQQVGSMASPSADLARRSGMSACSDNYFYRGSDSSAEVQRAAASESGGEQGALADGGPLVRRFSKLPSLRRLVAGPQARPPPPRASSSNSSALAPGTLSGEVAAGARTSISSADAGNSGPLPPLLELPHAESRGTAGTSSSPVVVPDSNMGKPRSNSNSKPLQGIFVRVKHVKGFEATATR